MNCIAKQILRRDISWYGTPEAKEFYEKLLIIGHSIEVVGCHYETMWISGIEWSEIYGWAYVFNERPDGYSLNIPCIEVVSFTFQKGRNENLINEFLYGKIK